MDHLRLALALSIAACLSSASLAARAQTAEKQFVILHTNDQHGHLLPFSFPSHVGANDDIGEMPVRKNIGGVARRATLIRGIRASHTNVHVFDAGDCMDGSPFSTEFHDAADYDALSAAGYDYAVFGNHDFNLTPAEFEGLRKHITFPMVLANVVNRGTENTPWPPYLIEDWDGLRVAILGLVTLSAHDYKAAKQAFDVRDPVEVARKYVPMLRKQADLVILVTHIGVDLDRKIAREVPGVDIIVGGHSHTRLAHGIYEAAAKPGPADPPGTIILQDGHYTGELGELDFTAVPGKNHRWHVGTYHDTLLALTSDIPDDPAVKNVIDRYWNQIKAKYSEVIGEAAGEFDDNQGEESTNYYLVADAVAEEAHAPFDLENQGGIRAPILQGPITRYDLVTVDPFIDTVVMCSVRGDSLRAICTRFLPQPSAGLRYTLRHRKANAGKEGEWKAERITIGGHALHDDSIYRFATNDWFARTIRSSCVEEHALKLVRIDATVAYVRRHSPIAPHADGRITMIEE